MSTYRFSWMSYVDIENFRVGCWMSYDDIDFPHVDIAKKSMSSVALEFYEYQHREQQQAATQNMQQPVINQHNNLAKVKGGGWGGANRCTMGEGRLYGRIHPSQSNNQTFNHDFRRA